MTARDPRIDPRDGDEVKFSNRFSVTVLLRTEDAMTVKVSDDDSGRTQTLTWRPLSLAFWREFASAGWVTRRGDD